MKKKGKKGGKMCKHLAPKIENGCGGKKGTKCEIPYIMPYAVAKQS